MASVLFILALVTLIFAWAIRRNRFIQRLPPLVPGLPLLGNTRQPMGHLQFDQWKERYGPIYSLNMAGSIIVVLASVQTATDVLDKMSSVSSGRSSGIMGRQLMLKRMFMASTWGEQFRRLRRGAHEVLNARAAKALYSVQEDEALRLARGLLNGDNSHDLRTHMSRVTASSLWRALYGGPSLDYVDSALDGIKEFMKTLSLKAQPGAALVDSIPALLYLPEALAPFKQFANSFHKKGDVFFRGLAKEARKRRTTSNDPSSLNISSSFYENREKSGLDEKDIAWATAELFGAGFETSSSTMQYFALAMVLYPEIARKAQHQLDTVIGQDRPPTFEDQDKLPYIAALIRETMRWRPDVPYGLEHAATEDIHYEGYIIPKGSTLIGAIWSICRDPELFPDPDVFRPERFLDDQDPTRLKLITESGARYSDFGFGFGRRICVGKDVALNSLFINVATLLWAFEFERARTKDGEEIVPESMELQHPGVIVSPKDFECALVSRSDRIRDILAAYRKEERS